MKYYLVIYTFSAGYQVVSKYLFKTIEAATEWAERFPRDDNYTKYTIQEVETFPE